MHNSRLKIILRIVLLLAGAALVFLAVRLAIQGVDWAAIRSAPPGLMLLLALGVAMNLLLTGVLFWAITKPFDAKPTVPIKVMVQLICASALLNYLPLRVGLLGRAAFLKKHYQLPVRQSGVILLLVMGLGALVLGVTGLAIILGPQAREGAVAMVAIVLLGLLSPLTGLLVGRVTGRPTQSAATIWWIPLRLMDMLVAGMRMWIAFKIVGHPVSYAQAISFGAVGMLISLTGLTPNGLGLKEWAIEGLARVVDLPHGVGAAATLVDRAVEAVVVIIAALGSIYLLKGVSPSEEQADESLPAGDSLS